MEYCICKDEIPQKTIERIRTILNSINISIEEKILERKDKSNNVTSARIYMYNILNFGANGKGISKENALASAYGEFMERLQNGFIFRFCGNSYYFSPDEKIYNTKDLLKNNEMVKILKDENTTNQIIDISHNKLFLYCMAKTLEKHKIKKLKKGQTVVVPFVSVKTKKKIFLPIILLQNFLQGTNGGAAGNTYEEAIVQGLSEICERYTIKKIFEERLSLPTIPSSYYCNFPVLSKLIKYIENNGYKITIKDASCGQKIPSVCTIFEDIKFPDNKISLSFCAHPNLQIAIERTLTEFLQGKDISNDSFRKMFFKEEVLDTFSSGEIYQLVIAGNPVFDKNSEIIKILNNSVDSYEFCFDTWNSQFISDNKILMKKLIDSLGSFVNDIYIRDCSFLGFPAVYIFIPEMSLCRTCEQEEINNHMDYCRWSNYSFGFVKNTESVDSLINAYNVDKYTSFSIGVSSLSSYYILLLCYILKDDKERILLYLNNISRVVEHYKKIGKDVRKYEIYEILRSYYELKLENIDENKIYEILSQNYNQQKIEKLRNLFKNLSFEYIKNQIRNNPDYLIDIKNKKVKKQVKELNKNLYSLLKNNISNQEKIVNVLSF